MDRSLIGDFVRDFEVRNQVLRPQTHLIHEVHGVEQFKGMELVKIEGSSVYDSKGHRNETNVLVRSRHTESSTAVRLDQQKILPSCFAGLGQDEFRQYRGHLDVQSAAIVNAMDLTQRMVEEALQSNFPVILSRVLLRKHGVLIDVLRKYPSSPKEIYLMDWRDLVLRKFSTAETMYAKTENLLPHLVQYGQESYVEQPDAYYLMQLADSYLAFCYVRQIPNAALSAIRNYPNAISGTFITNPRKDFAFERGAYLAKERFQYGVSGWVDFDAGYVRMTYGDFQAIRKSAQSIPGSSLETEIAQYRSHCLGYVDNASVYKTEGIELDKSRQFFENAHKWSYTELRDFEDSKLKTGINRKDVVEEVTQMAQLFKRYGEGLLVGDPPAEPRKT